MITKKLSISKKQLSNSKKQLFNSKKQFKSKKVSKNWKVSKNQKVSKNRKVFKNQKVSKTYKNTKGGAAANSRTKMVKDVQVVTVETMRQCLYPYLQDYYPEFPSKRIPNVHFFTGKDATEMGRFSYKANSCWLDSSIFTLMTSGNTQIINSLLKLNNRDTHDCKILAPLTLVEQKEIKFLLQSTLTMGYIIISWIEKKYMDESSIDRKDINLEYLRFIFSCCPSIARYNNSISHAGGSANYNEFINHLFEIFPLPRTNHLVIETNTYHVLDETGILGLEEKHINFEVNKGITKASKTLISFIDARDITEGDKEYNPAINQKKIIIKVKE